MIAAPYIARQRTRSKALIEALIPVPVDAPQDPALALWNRKLRRFGQC